MANNKDTDLLLIIGGGIAVLVAALFGVNHLKQNQQNNSDNITEPTTKSCNKCPFSK